MTAEAMEAGPLPGPVPGTTPDVPPGAAADGDRPLRIALLTYKGNPFCGGQGVYVRHLSRELVRLGHRVEVIGAQPYPVLDEGEDLRGLGLTELPSLDLYRSPDPFRTPKRDEYRDWIDALEVATMWTGGFPEPVTFSLRARRHLRARRGDFDVVHDNQTLGYGLLGDLGAPLVTTVHHPITVDRRLELDAAPDWKRRASVRRWYAFTRMQKRVARRLPSILTVSGTSRQEIVDHLGVRPDRVDVVHIGADTNLFSPDPAVPEVPGRIVTTSSADVPLKGLIHLVEALAKLRDRQAIAGAGAHAAAPPSSRSTTTSGCSRSWASCRSSTARPARPTRARERSGRSPSTSRGPTKPSINPLNDSRTRRSNWRPKMRLMARSLSVCHG